MFVGSVRGRNYFMSWKTVYVLVKGAKLSWIKSPTLSMSDIIRAIAGMENVICCTQHLKTFIKIWFSKTRGYSVTLMYVMQCTMANVVVIYWVVAHCACVLQCYDHWVGAQNWYILSNLRLSVIIMVIVMITHYMANPPIRCRGIDKRVSYQMLFFQLPVWYFCSFAGYSH